MQLKLEAGFSLHNSPYIPGFQLVLASQSPRRRDLLNMAALPFVSRPPYIEEIHRPTESARDYVSRLCSEKATATAHQEFEGVLAADTTVVVSNGNSEVILEKPADAADARRMISLLAGREHSVLTAICFLWRRKQSICVEETRVHFVQLSSSEIDSYVSSGEPFDKAGGYAIQGLASRYISRIEGCYFNVVGLPVHRVVDVLNNAGVLVRA